MGLGGAAFGQPGAGGQQPDLQAMMQQFQQALSQMGMGGLFGGAPGAGGDAGGARWTQIRDIARRVVAVEGPDPSPTSRDLDGVRDAVRLADAWLDAATQFPATGGPVAAWSRAEWVENTMPTWRRLIDPVAASLAEAMANSMSPDEGEGDDMLGGLEALLRPWLRSSGATIFGLQAGQAIGALAASVVSPTETGLPLDGDRGNVIALVHHNAAAFGEGLSQTPQDVTLYLALRECARQRLFASVPWLGPQMLALVEQYARGITIDLSGIEEAVGELDPARLTPDRLQELSEQLQGNLFEPKQTPEQRAVLERLETLLALVEGWVDEVVTQATARWMPSSGALAEAVRRRHASGGPIEATFKTLVGLELRPRRLRDAANLWAALRDARSADGRDAVWNHPDLLPTSADLDDPLGFVAGERREAATTDPLDTVDDEVDDMDAELERLLDDAARARDDSDRGDDAPGDDPAAGDGPKR
ncbi:zinc-dependent metalloprotease [Mariniluteicoccus endophyticus]